MEEFAVLVGAIASAISLVGGLAAALRHLRQRRLRRHLSGHLQRVRRLDKRLVALTTEAALLLNDGVGWHGIAIPPPSLRGHLAYLDTQLDELERSRAQIRALPTRGANDRLRETVEDAIGCLRTAYLSLRDGIWSTYREHEGEQIGWGATGRGPVTLFEDSHRELESLRPKMELAVRTAAYQLNEEAVAEAYECRWPLIEGELPLSANDLWGNEPRPLPAAAFD